MTFFFQKRLNQIEFGVDYPSVKSTVEQFKQENKTVEQYNKKIAACSSPKLVFIILNIEALLILSI